MKPRFDMTSLYRHTQIGTVMLCILGGVIAMAAGLGLWGSNPVPPLPLLVTGLVLASFSTLTVAVEAQAVGLSFGPGIIRKRIPLSSIRSIRAVRNKWYYGWGIRLTPTGWLWNVSGLGGVELQLADGALFRIGTDEPDKLARVLRDAIQAV